jgi:hypothetical protein
LGEVGGAFVFRTYGMNNCPEPGARGAAGFRGGLVGVGETASDALLAKGIKEIRRSRALAILNSGLNRKRASLRNLRYP